MKSVFSFLSLVVFVFSFLPIVQAQEAYQLSVTGPSSVELNEDVVVVLEVTDAEGPATGIAPEITFEPGNAVTDEALYDCEDPDMFENCAANHRGVAGVFEVAFTLVKDDVVVEVQAAGLQEQLKLQVEGIETPETVASNTSAEKTTSQAQLKPEDIQAGPWPSFWFVMMPFILMMVVVTGFIGATTR